MENILAEESFKVLVVGEKLVGKTSFIRKLTDNKFSSDVPSSPSINFYYRKIEMNGKQVLLNIYDAPGTFNHDLTNLYFSKVDVVVILYDVTDPSWYIGVSDWLKEIQKEAHEYLSVCLVGNKQDLNQSSFFAGNGNFEKFSSSIDLHDVISCKESESLGKLWIDMVTLIHHKEDTRLERFQIQNIVANKTVIRQKRKPLVTKNWLSKFVKKLTKSF